MERDTFDRMIEDLYSFFQVDRRPTSKVLAMWFDKTKGIPNLAVGWIRERIEEERDALPRNMPKWLMTYFAMWRQAHPESVIDQPVVPCTQCGGYGFLWAKRPVAGYMLRVTFICGDCSNAGRHLGAEALELHERAHRFQLESDSWDVRGAYGDGSEPEREGI
jgi:hypothetical protein